MDWYQKFKNCDLLGIKKVHTRPRWQGKGPKSSLDRSKKVQNQTGGSKWVQSCDVLTDLPAWVSKGPKLCLDVSQKVLDYTSFDLCGSYLDLNGGKISKIASW